MRSHRRLRLADSRRSRRGCGARTETRARPRDRRIARADGDVGAARPLDRGPHQVDAREMLEVRSMPASPPIRSTRARDLRYSTAAPVRSTRANTGLTRARLTRASYSKPCTEVGDVAASLDRAQRQAAVAMTTTAVSQSMRPESKTAAHGLSPESNPPMARARSLLPSVRSVRRVSLHSTSFRGVFFIVG